MSEIERHVTAVVSTTEFDYYQEYEDCCNHELVSKQETFNLDELLKQDWFVDLLKIKGFYSKDELGIKHEYLDRFVYEYKGGGWNYSAFAESLKNIQDYNEIIAVYQEVIGPERLKAYAKWKRSHDEYLKKEAERLKKDLEKKALAKEKKRLKDIEKAKNYLNKKVH